MVSLRVNRSKYGGRVQGWRFGLWGRPVALWALPILLPFLLLLILPSLESLETSSLQTTAADERIDVPSFLDGDWPARKRQKQEKTTAGAESPVLFSIKSKQITRVSGEQQQWRQRQRQGPSTSSQQQQQQQQQEPAWWEVSECFSLDEDISYSLHLNELAPSESFALLAHKGRSYYLIGPEEEQPECRLDHRQDHSALFPWLYSSTPPPATGQGAAANEEAASNDGQNNNNNTTTTTNRAPAAATVLGVGALWLNALERRANCRLEPSAAPSSQDGNSAATILSCTVIDATRRLEYKLSFLWPLARESPLAALKSARVSRRQAIHLGPGGSGGDSSSGLLLAEEVVVDIDIVSAERSLSPSPPFVSERIRSLLFLCLRSVDGTQTLFPNFMRHLVERPKMNYHLEYMAKLYDNDDDDGDQQLAQQRGPIRREYLVNEWFSYELEAQTITRKITKERGEERPAQQQREQQLRRLFGFLLPTSHRPASFLLEPNVEGGPMARCRPEQPDDEHHDDLLLASSSGLMRRWLHFVGRRAKQQRGQTGADKFRPVHSGVLVGLGALLMNAADLHDKQLLPPASDSGSNSNDTTTTAKQQQPAAWKNHKWTNAVEWVAEDETTGERVHFYFRKRDTSQKQNHDCEIEDLLKVQLWRPRKPRPPAEPLLPNNDGSGEESSRRRAQEAARLGGLTGDQEQVAWLASYWVVMEIDLLGFKSSLGVGDLAKVFYLPHFCPFKENLITNDNDHLQDDEAAKVDDDDTTTTSANGAAATTTAPKPLVLANAADDEHEQELAEERLPPYEFPSLEQSLDLERDYSLSSEWHFGEHDTGVKLFEFRLRPADSDDDAHLFSRLDTIKLGENNEETRFYMSHSSGRILKFKQGSCEQVDKLEQWLELLAWPAAIAATTASRPGSDDSTATAAITQLREYGVGGLWRLASRSPHVEFLGVFPAPVPASPGWRRALWRLENEPKLVGLKLVFEFEFFRTRSHSGGGGDSHWPGQRQHFQLDSIQVDTSLVPASYSYAGQPVKHIQIREIRLEPGAASALHFILPSTCDPIHEHFPEYQPEAPHFPALTFPGFFQTFHAPPDDAKFEFRYEIRLGLFEEGGSPLQAPPNISYVLRAHETNTGDQVGRLSLEFGDRQANLWLLEGGSTLIEQPKQRHCQRIVPLHRFFEITEPLEELMANKVDLKTASSNFLLANLWSLMEARIESEAGLASDDKKVTMSKGLDVFQGEHLRQVEWSLSSEHSSMAFTFWHSYQKNSLTLDSVSLVSATGKFTLRLTILHPPVHEAQASRNQDDEIYNLHLPPSCLGALYGGSLDDEDGGFPKLSKLLAGRGAERQTGIHMRSELISSSRSLANVATSAAADGGSASQSYLLLQDEWLQMGRAYRSRTQGRENEQNYDQLLYNDTREFFDLSEANECPTRPPCLGLEPNGGSKEGAAARGLEEASTTDSGHTDKCRDGDWISANLLWAADDRKPDAFYGPLAMWWLAELPEMEHSRLEANITLREFIENETKVLGMHLYEHWRVWHSTATSVSYTMRFNRDSSRLNGSNGGGRDERTVLERVEATNWRSNDHRQTIVLDVVNYQYVSFARDDAEEPLIEELLVPIGRGCRRRQQKDYDVLRFEAGPMAPFAFDYEASLELLRPISAAAAASTPQIDTIDSRSSGWVGVCPDAAETWAQMIEPFRVNHERRHYLNGSVASLRRIVSSESPDGSLSQCRTLNEITGSCSIWRCALQKSSDILVLNFGNLNESIIINDSLLSSLASSTATGHFEQIQQRHWDQARGGYTEVVYEMRTPSFKLSDQLEGPASIIRTFERAAPSEEHHQSATNELRLRSKPYHHSSVKIEVLILDRAKLTLQIKNLVSPANCLKMLTEARAQDCYESSDALVATHPGAANVELNGLVGAVGGLGGSRLRCFTMGFRPIIIRPPQAASQSATNVTNLSHVGALTQIHLDFEHFEELKPALEELCLKMLLALPVDLKALQVSDSLKLSYRHSDESVHVQFKLMEPPTAIEYFSHRPQTSLDWASTGGSGLDMRLMSSAHSCSHWCDSVQCTAFSYCHQERLCQLGTLTYGTEGSKEPLKSNVHLKEDAACDYYEAPNGRLRQPLRKVIEFIEQELNRVASALGGSGTSLNSSSSNQHQKENNEESLFSFSLTTSRHEQVRFQASGEFIEQANNEPSERDSAQVTLANGRRQSAYVPVETNGEFALDRIQQQQQDQLANVIVALSQVKNQAECLASCSKETCQLGSFCGQTCVVLSNITDWRTYELLVGRRQRLQQQESEPFIQLATRGCSVFSEDFLLDYQHFFGTQQPSSYVTLEHNLSLVECAARCQLSSASTTGADDCLSFDYCTQTTTTTNEKSVSSLPSSGSLSSSSSHCYLQSVHLMMDHFDESILRQQQQHHLVDQASGSINHVPSPICSHYSKSLVSDFVRLPNKRFAHHQSVVFKGSQLESCALICRRDGTCLAFEHCVDLDNKPQAKFSASSSCYILRGREDDDNENNNKATSTEQAGQEWELEDAAGCSVYRTRQQLATAAVTTEESSVVDKLSDQQQQQGGGAASGFWLSPFERIFVGHPIISAAILAGYLTGAMVLGSLLHILFIWVTGDNLPLFR